MNESSVQHFAMFSSNPFAQLPSSISNFPPDSNFDHEKHDAYFNYHQSNDDPFISGDCFLHGYNDIAPPSPLIMENVTAIKQDFVRSHQLQLSEGSGLQYCEDNDELLDSVVSGFKKKMATTKKDGHSKIYTARGPRDRRVRLSIGIARKFFCLQDLLGFDKASKTLDWLFTKSKTAIKELVQETKNSSSGSSSVAEVNFLESIDGGSDEEGKGQKKLKCSDGKRKNTTRKSKTGFQVNLAKEQSRADARARARERTREKMLTKKLDDEYLKTLVPDDFDPTLQSSCWSQFESQNCDYKDITWESILDPETFKKSKDSSFHNNYTGLPNFRTFPDHQQQGDHSIDGLDP